MSKGRRRFIAIVVLLLAAPVLVDVLWTSDEERIETTLAALEAGLEARDAARVTSHFADEVRVDAPILGLPVREALPEGIRLALAHLSKLQLDVDETCVSFPESDRAAVHLSGTGFAEASGFGGIFRHTMDLEFVRVGERFLLDHVVRVRIEPGFG